MNKAEEVFDLVFSEFVKYDTTAASGAISEMESHGKRDVLDKTAWGYYQWLPCLLKVTKPKQIVELGGSVGTACLMMLTALAKDSKLYSINLEVHGEEFCYIKKDYPNLIKVIGDDLDLANWPKDLDLSATDIIFIDTEHEKELLTNELNTYFPLLKKGTIILLDDIHLNSGMEEVWNQIKCDKFDATRWLHFSGFGIVYKNFDNWC